MQKARTRRNGLACLGFWPSGAAFDKTALFFDGMPYVPAITPMTQYLVDRGYGVLQPQYMGTFDSDGKLTPQSAVDTVFEVTRQLKENPWYNYRSEAEFRVAEDVDLAVAHSYGTNVLFSALLQGFRPRVMILKSPFFLFGSNAAEAGQRGDFTGHVRQMIDALPLTFRFESNDEWFDYFVNSPQVHPAPEAVSAGTRTKLLCVVGDNDGDIDPQVSRSYLETLADRYGHAFELVDYLVIPGAKHDQSTMMVPEFLQAVDNLIG